MLGREWDSPLADFQVLSEAAKLPVEVQASRAADAGEGAGGHAACDSHVGLAHVVLDSLVRSRV